MMLFCKRVEGPFFFHELYSISKLYNSVYMSIFTVSEINKTEIVCNDVILHYAFQRSTV